MAGRPGLSSRDRGFYDEMAFGTSKFENSDNKFEGMFKNDLSDDDLRGHQGQMQNPEAEGQLLD